MNFEIKKEREMISIAKFFCFFGLIIIHCLFYGRNDVSRLLFWGANTWFLKLAASLNVCMLYLAFFGFANQCRQIEHKHRLSIGHRAIRYALILIALENVISLLSYKRYESLTTGLPLTAIGLNLLLIVFFWKKNRYLVFLSSVIIYLLCEWLLPSIYKFEISISRIPIRFLILAGAAQFLIYLILVLFVLIKILPFNRSVMRNILISFSTVVLYKFSSQRFSELYFFIPRLFLGSQNSPVLYPVLIWNPVFVSSFAMYFIFELNFMKKLREVKVMIVVSILTYVAYLYWFEFFNMFNFNFELKNINSGLLKFSQVTIWDCLFQMIPLTSLLLFSYQFRFVFYKFKRLGSIISLFSESILYIYLGIILSGTFSSRIWPLSLPLRLQLLLQLAYYFLLSVVIAFTHKWFLNNSIKLKIKKSSTVFLK